MMLKEKATEKFTEKDAMHGCALADRMLFRQILPEEADQAVEMETICFPPNEACSEEMMRERIAKVPDQFLVAVDQTTGKLAAFLCGIATMDTVFRDDFFKDASLHDPKGDTVMLLGLNVLPAYRMQGLAREVMGRYLEKEREKGRKRVNLTCLEGKIAMYEKMGFQNLGISGSTWGDEQWYDMCYTFSE